jgi:hypothetical protein
MGRCSRNVPAVMAGASGEFLRPTTNRLTFNCRQQ